MTQAQEDVHVSTVFIHIDVQYILYFHLTIVDFGLGFAIMPTYINWCNFTAKRNAFFLNLKEG